MDEPRITFIIDGNTYSLRSSDTGAIREIPSADRKQLIALLESVKQQDILAQTAVEQAVTRATHPSHSPPNEQVQSRPPGDPAIKPERLGSGDVDAIMARLIMEEENSRKPGLTKQGIYKLLAGFAVVVFLLILIL